MVKNILIGGLALGVAFLLFRGKNEVVVENTTVVTKTEVVTDTVETVKTDTVIIQKEKPLHLTTSSKELQEEVLKLNDAYKKMTDSGDKNEVLKFFNENFTSNVVNIGSDNAVMVDRKTSKSQYGMRLEDLISMEGLKIEMFNTKFFDTYTRGDLGVSVYSTKYIASINGKNLVEGKLMGMIAAKKYDASGLWKIGNYTLINVRNKENMKPISLDK